MIFQGASFIYAKFPQARHPGTLFKKKAHRSRRALKSRMQRGSLGDGSPILQPLEIVKSRGQQRGVLRGQAPSLRSAKHRFPESRCPASSLALEWPMQGPFV